jgi:hypothetical protein
MSTSNGKLRILGLAAFACATAAPAAMAGPTGNASAYDLSVHINLLGVSQLNVDPQAPAHVADATSSVADSQQLASLDVQDPLGLLKLQTGLLQSQAEYVGGNFAVVGAESVVSGLDLSAVTLLAAPVIGLGADAVTSRSVLAGSCPPPAPSRDKSLIGNDFLFFYGFDKGNLSAVDGTGGGDTGSGGLPGSGAKLGNLALSLLGTNVPIPLSPPPNTAVDLNALGLAGATLILNEQTMSGDGIHELGMVSNAVRLSLNVAGLITADVIVAHSEASLTCP